MVCIASKPCVDTRTTSTPFNLDPWNSKIEPKMVQLYMRKKRQEWKKKQKDEVALSRAALRAKKEKLEALEMERRALLCSEGVNSPEKSGTVRRPQWDSNISLPANEIKGSWPNVLGSTTEVDFPLPKPVDAEEFPDLCIESDENTDAIIDCHKVSRSKMYPVKAGITSERDRLLSKAGSPRGKKIASGNNYACNGAHKNSISLQSSESRKLKKGDCISKFIKHDGGTKKVQCCSQKSLGENTKKPIRCSNLKQEKEILTSKQSLVHRIVHYSSDFPDRHPKTRLTNKRKITAFGPADETLNACERRDKMPTRRKLCSSEVGFLVPSSQDTHLPDFRNLDREKDDHLKQKAYHTQCITFHLEKLPHKYEPEVLNERKRVALLKLLAQQLVKRIDAAQSCSTSLPHIGNAQEHTFLLKRKFVKFQKKLRSIERALGEECPLNSGKKTCEYIVLPCKLQRNYRHLSIATGQEGGSEENYKLLELRNSGTNQIVASCSSSSDVSFQASISSIVSLSNGETSSERLVSSYIPGELGKGQLQHQDSLNSSKDRRVEKVWHNGSHGQGIQMWDHQLLVKELEKLDGEIRDTKARMANKLILVSPGVDKDLAMSSVSNVLVFDDHVQFPSKKEQAQARDGETLQDSGDHLNIKINDPPFSDFVESSVGNSIHRKQVKPVEMDKKSGEDVSGVDTNCPAMDEQETDSYQRERKDSRVCNIDIESNQSKDNNATLMTMIHSSMTADSTTENVTCHLNRVTKDTSSCIKPEVKNEVLKIELPMDVLAKEIVSKSHIGKEYLAESIINLLMEELVEHELSDFLLHLSSSGCKLEHVAFGESCIGSNYDNFSTGYKQSEIHTIKVESSTDHVLCKTRIESNNTNLMKPLEQTQAHNVTVEYSNHSNLQGEPLNNQHDAQKESNDAAMETFRTISKRLVGKFVEMAFDLCGLNSSNLIDVYAADKTMAMLVVEVMSKEEFEAEDVLYGKFLIGAVSECLYQSYSSFYLPLFFLFLQPCPDRPRLEQIVISKVNEQAEATAAEGGFSLEHMLERSLDYQDWRNPYCEMMEVAENVCEQIMQDMMESFVDEMLEPIAIREAKAAC